MGTALTPCTQPISVETVEDPAGRPAGVYTKVTWHMGDLPKGTDGTIRYVAGIPLQANEPFSGTTPTPESLGQASNLDNNTGDSTREQPANGGEQGLTNTAVVTGTYTGHTQGHRRSAGHRRGLADGDRRGRAAGQVGGPEGVRSGEVATFTLDVDVSEYVDASAVVVTDTLP